MPRDLLQRLPRWKSDGSPRIVVETSRMILERGTLVMVKKPQGYSWITTKFIGKVGIITMSLNDKSVRKPDSQIMVYFPEGKEFFFFEDELVEIA